MGYGIYIEGGELPTECNACMFCYLFPLETELRCQIKDKVVSEKGRDEDCPIIEVKEHGRLIDADALIEELSVDPIL